MLWVLKLLSYLVPLSVAICKIHRALPAKRVDIPVYDVAEVGTPGTEGLPSSQGK